MNKQTREILKVIKSGITGEGIELSEELSLDKLMEIAEKHSIHTMIYYGLDNCGVLINSGFKAKLSEITVKEILVSERQLYCIKEISHKFDECGIVYMMLKGSVLKNLYPKSEIRRMGDIDILIKEEQYIKIAEIMKSLGFCFRNESDHEIIWIKNNIIIELHKIMMPSYNIDFHNYFGNGWKRAVKIEKCRYVFSDDDMLVYIFTHFAKHYRDAGIGIMHMCDLYVYLKLKAINDEYISNELKKLKLYDFYINIRRTLAVWFEDGEGSEITDYITRVIFNSGAYGLHENIPVSSAVRERKKIKNIALARIHRIFSKVFPSLCSMGRRYNILKKAPVLLPFVWVWRWVDIIFNRRNLISENINDICAVDVHQIQDYEEALKCVGLDYNF